MTRNEGEVGPDGFAILRRTAVMLRMPSRTRFASIESTLEAYLRTRATLVGIVQAPEFSTKLYDARSNAEKQHRAQEYVAYIESGEFTQTSERLKI